jgi:hypothetical protein
LNGGTKQLQRPFDNSTTVAWSAGGINIGSGAAITNQGGALWDVQADLNFGNLGGSPTFTNLGTYQKSGGTGTHIVSSNLALTNTGTLDVQTGTVQLDGTLTHNTGALMMGGGTIDLPASYTFNGDINPGTVGTVGALTIIGNLTLGASSVLTIDATTGPAFDVLNVTGNLVRAGTVTFNNISAPTSSVLTFATMTGTDTGTFATILPAGQGWNVSPSGGGVIQTVVP